MRLSPPTARQLLAFLVAATASPAVAEAQEEWPQYQELKQNWEAVDSTLYRLNWQIQSDSSDVEAFTDLVLLLKRRGDPEDQLAAAEAMAAANPDSSAAWFLLGDALLDNGLPIQAVPVLQRVLEIEPHYVRALTMLAEAYSLERRYDSALHALNRAVEVNPRNAQSFAQRSQLLTTMGRRIEAAGDLRDWARLAPTNPDPWIRLGAALLDIGDVAEGVASLEYAASLEPRNADLQFRIADTLARKGPTEQAISALREFFYEFPEDPRTLDAERRVIELGGSMTRR